MNCNNKTIQKSNLDNLIIKESLIVWQKKRILKNVIKKTITANYFARQFFTNSLMLSFLNRITLILRMQNIILWINLAGKTFLNTIEYLDLKTNEWTTFVPKGTWDLLLKKKPRTRRNSRKSVSEDKKSQTVTHSSSIEENKIIEEKKRQSITPSNSVEQKEPKSPLVEEKPSIEASNGQISAEADSSTIHKMTTNHETADES